MQLGQQVDAAGGGDRELDNPHYRVPEGQLLVEALKDLVHEEADSYHRQARAHHERYAGCQRRFVGVTVDECLGERSADHGRDHLEDEQGSHRDSDPSGCHNWTVLSKFFA
ncbi:hypothetical protein Q9G87_08405 [Nonomuraea sp. G32]|nr:hypothetical protein [Nonomuraea sp. G32]MDP4501978.1 hypothetical protein [Nonomuraea sp. G32]